MRSANSPIRIAFLTHEPFYPPSGGGSAEALYLVQELVQRGHEIHIFCPKLADPEAVRAKFGVHLHEFATWEMGRYTRLRNFKYVLYPFFLERLVKQTAKTTPFDLILSQHAISAVTAGRLKKSLKIPIVMNFLDHLTGFMETWPSYIAPKPLISALKRFELSLPTKYHAEAVLTVSDALADLFAANGCERKRLLPIYFGYDSHLFEFQKRPPRQPARDPMVVMHGSFDVHHLGAIAFEAVKTVFSARPETCFRFVGHCTGPMQKLLNRAQAEIPKAKVECTGFVPYDQVPRYLAPADVGIIPYEESIGTQCAFVAKPVEYAALGIPVVCTPLKSVKSYFGNTPLVRFSEFDGQDFGKTILSWFDVSPDQITTWGMSASEKVRKELDWRSISRKVADRVEQIAHAGLNG